MKYVDSTSDSIDAAYIQSREMGNPYDPTFKPLHIDATHVVFHNQAKIGIGVNDKSAIATELYVDGTITYTTALTHSDARWKRNIIPIDRSLDMVKQMKGR